MLTGCHLLRALRKQRGKSLESVAEDAGISYKCLSELERGHTCQPSRKLLEAVLRVLNGYMPVSMEEQRAVYIGYGYTPPCPLPIAEEVAAARACWHDVFHNVPMPAYLIDVGQRLLASNHAAHRLMELCTCPPRVRNFRHTTTIDLIFGPAPRLASSEDDATFQRSFVHTLKRELHCYAVEPWYAHTIAAAQQRYPDFKCLWAMEHPPPVSPVGCPVPLKVRLPEYSDALTLRRVKIPFVGDPRFQTVQWQPADATTWQAWGRLMP